MPEQRYGKVIDGQIVEFPVALIHIQNRHESVDSYTPVVEGLKPTVPDFHYYEETPYLQEGKIFLHYSVQPLSADFLLQKIHTDRMQQEGGSVGPDQQYPDILISTVDPTLALWILKLVKDHVQLQLDKLAATRDYDTCGSAINYLSSNVPRFKADAEFMVGLRDDTWVTLYHFQNEMAAGNAPIPKTLAQITAMLPEMAWPADSTGTVDAQTPPDA